MLLLGLALLAKGVGRLLRLLWNGLRGAGS
jgi:hypothetical protein